MPHREQSLVYEVQKSDLTRDSSEWLRKHSEMSVVVWGEVESKVEIHARADIGSAISGKGGRDLPWLGGGQSRWRSSRERRTTFIDWPQKRRGGTLKEDDVAERIGLSLSKEKLVGGGE